MVSNSELDSLHFFQKVLKNTFYFSTSRGGGWFWPKSGKFHLIFFFNPSLIKLSIALILKYYSTPRVCIEVLRFKKFLLIIKRKHYFCLIVHLTARSKSFKIACVIGSMVLNKQHFQNHIMVLKVCISLEIKIVNFDMTISVLYEYYIFCGMTYHYSSTC